MVAVEEVIIYPVKSLGGSRKKAWKTSKTGFLYDRHWMLTDEKGNFLTQREIPGLCTFFADIEDEKLVIKHGETTISIPVHQRMPDPVQSRVWDDTVIVHKVHPETDEFFCDLLQKKVSLVVHSPLMARKHHVNHWNTDIEVSLADGYPYLITGTSSMDALCEKLGFPVSHDRFRPNILVTTREPHEEDAWSSVVIGSAAFRNVKPCARCQIVNIHQADGSYDNRILKELSNYRRDGNKVIFGTLMTCVEDGIVSVGDTVRINQDKPSSLSTSEN